MNLEQIRQKVAYAEQKIDLKESCRTWSTNVIDSKVALTLTLKQSFQVKTINGSYYKRLDREYCALIAARFKKKLNQLIYGNAAKRYNKSLKYLISVEGGVSGKRLHLHVALGEFPRHIRFNKIEALIAEAASKVEEIYTQRDIQISDSGWAEYVVKQVGKNTDRILWDLL